MSLIRSTTVLAIIHNNEMVIASDGQVTLGSTIVKENVKKIRKIANGKILVGFAGSTADSFSLFEKFEEKLNSYNNNMQRSAIELAKDWRQDKYLRKLEAMLLAVNKDMILTISGTGDVIESEDQLGAIGSGSMYAKSAALALKRQAAHLSAEQIVKESMKIAADICIYTNHTMILEKIVPKDLKVETVK